MWFSRGGISLLPIIRFRFVFLCLSCLIINVRTVSSLTFQTRKCSLLSWKDNIEIGTIQERRGPGLHEVSIGVNSDKNGVVTVNLPYFQEAGSVGSSLWPAGLAGAILLHCNTLQELTRDKDIIELGAGLGLGGLGVAKQASRCVITDNDEELVRMLQECLSKNDFGDHGDTVEAQCLDWRDSDPEKQQTNDDKYDVCLGFDVAYYHHLLGPLVTTAKQKLKEKNSLMFVLGQANREYQWKLYHHILEGGYNQMSDENEPPWEGTTKMMLYKLNLGFWKEGETEPEAEEDDSNNIDGVIPIAAILYTTPDLEVSEITPHDYVATQLDENAQEMSF